MNRRERDEARPLGPSGIPLGQPLYISKGISRSAGTCDVCWESVRLDDLPWMHRRTKHEREWGHAAVLR